MPIAFRLCGEHHGLMYLRITAIVRLLAGAALAAIVSSGPGHAQVPIPIVGPLLNGERPDPGENALQQAESERVHRTALKNIPDKKASKDPWHSIRPDAQTGVPDRHRPN